MGVKIRQVNSDYVTYDVIPEVVTKEDLKAVERLRDMHEISNGYNKSKSMRHVGQIPQAVLYNHAMMKGIPPAKHGEYYAADNGKKIMELLKEFPVFKTVDKL